MYLVECINDQILSPSAHLVREPQGRPTGKEWTGYIIERICPLDGMLEDDESGEGKKDGEGALGKEKCGGFE